MTHVTRRHYLGPGWLAAGCAALLLAAAMPSAPAQAQEDNLPDVQLLRSILSGLGLKRGDEPTIDYRERSPLVVPQDMTLPPPDNRTLAQQNPEWPVDQDLTRRKALAAARAKQGIAEFERNAQPLGPKDLTPGRGRAPAGAVRQSQSPEEGSAPVQPSALGYVGGLYDMLFNRDKPESKAFVHEPPRTALIQPPPGYQTPSAAQPYGVGKRRDDDKRIKSSLDPAGIDQ